ncbi:probable cyclin-dependent serine/threonine-protein kinase DDB_G0292550 [Scaptodrosophila lebanonensis]|uniref:Probable cyclin-dependent serine/threonine-protein kinase DDB_G0292550 n=1 Tax=Drosophila lebanonensis TaxID=7225 RepID=A0A6J2TXW8_DROLE|nr:probable cyclin-dependent serine/threonine-protein kinase DDB_G0292550 [Scaptodrosophila lebanonensis]
MDFPESSQRSIRSATPPNGMENDQMPITQRSNHVSSVLLYGIPIVSLYIEGQERLCLAQISNTLLKQFSYNEIHNRRVALGITCVQCTPVQLEILRRAGAMPVSSRRCGMITRREAERLCKSFLGDNTPPRLPDDFAFNVQHKCAWGCRGSFLPSRYNSSRAKCIKCTYCGMFFSPNKFIFHSHRISTNDRYVQPDAANFNSWRRHMMLSGQPHEEIIHAWEDVKAMFNGGTRKRLVSSSSNSNGNQNSPNSSATINHSNNNHNNVIGSTCNSPSESDEKMQLCDESPCTKRPTDHQYNYSTVAAAAAVVGVTAVAAATVGVPFNLHRSSVLSPLQPLRNEHDLSIMPLSRNFVVDYMWQQQQNSKKAGEATAHSFETCPIPWVRPDLNATSSASNTLRLMHHHQQPFNVKNEAHSAICGIFKNRKLPDISSSNNCSGGNGNANANNNSAGGGGELQDCNIPSVFNSSAFKPVVASAAIVSTSLYAARSSDSNSNVYISPAQSTRTTTVLTHNTVTATTNRLPTSAIFRSASSTFSPILDSMQSSLESEQAEFSEFETTHLSSVAIKKSNIGNADKSLSSESVSDKTSSHSGSHSESPIDIDGFTTDAEDQFDLKSNICSYDNKISRSYFKVCNNDKDKFITPSNEVNMEDEMLPLDASNESKSTEDANELNGHIRKLAKKKGSNQQTERQISKKKGSTKVINDKMFSKIVTSAKPNLQRVTFPVFLKSQMTSIRQHHQRQPSPNSLGDSTSKWSYSYPMGNIRQFYCYETTSNENGPELN